MTIQFDSRFFCSTFWISFDFNLLLLQAFQLKGVVFRWLRHERSRKRFSQTHLGVWVLVCGGYRSHGLWDCSLFLLPFTIALPPTHPPTHPSSFLEFFPEVSFFQFLFVVGRFICIQSSSYCSFQIIFFRTSVFVLLWMYLFKFVLSLM